MKVNDQWSMIINADLPGEAAAVPGDLAARPEVGGSVCGHQAEEVLALLL